MNEYTGNDLVQGIDIMKNGYSMSVEDIVSELQRLERIELSAAKACNGLVAPDFDVITDALDDLAEAQENGILSPANQYPIAAIRAQIEALDLWQAARAQDGGEPFAWVSEAEETGQMINGRSRKLWWECRSGVGTPLYTQPQSAPPEFDAGIPVSETEQKAEPVAWLWVKNGLRSPVSKDFADELIEDGEDVQYLYTQPQSADPWIKCSDKLPPMNKEFDAWHRSGERLANHGAYVGSWDDEFRAEVLRLNGITYWMEKPAGPVE